ncbi:probable pectinesterase 53 isoform X2 [Punica granatum]|uniref:Pectinesterase n=1 Tax=Punica granatum TaxID=22663 RepID=A0A6P8ENQ5_PUNGR|nr:probable pectinesterase 53 isoform X2 [Punica granatum]
MHASSAITLTQPMASPLSYSYFSLIFFLLISLLGTSSSASSSTSSHRLLTPERANADRFKQWLAWNVKNHRQKSALRSELAAAQLAPNTTWGALDWQLRKAEENTVEVTVSQDGTGDYKSVKEALDTIPLFNTRRVIVKIKPGVYWEKISIPRALPFVTFFGDASDPPTITGNDTASVTGSGGTPLRTFQSATVVVDANYFVAINIRFENTAPHEVGFRGQQAVALRVSGNKAAFYNCSFIGSQDTLYDHKGLHYFNHCFIQGSVDFIFGYGRSLYENCYLNSVAKKVASVTAQKRTESSMASGFSFKNSTVTGTGLIYLGRAWGDYSRVVFSYTFMDKLVLPQGWSDWGKPKRDPRVYYGEYNCRGPGANTTGRVAWARILSDEEAQPFLGTYYIDGDSWLLSP